jgi:hypothetical protein
MVQGFCVKCKAKREIQNPTNVTLKNGNQHSRAHVQSAKKNNSHRKETINVNNFLFYLSYF